MLAIISLVVVLPLLPVTASSGSANRPRQSAAKAPSDSRVSATWTSGNDSACRPSAASVATIAAAAPRALAAAT
jgi:hypothetical protein